MSQIESLEVAGVPIVLSFPDNRDKPAPLIVLWHGFNTPNSEQALAKTIPLEGVNAWKAYLGLPLFGARMPVGGIDELTRRVREDYLLQLFLPVVEGAVRELPNVVEALQSRFDIQSDFGIGLFGFSAGGFAAMLALAENKIPIKAAVLAGVSKDISSAVRATEQFNNSEYQWTEASQAASRRIDFVLRSEEIVINAQLPAMLFLHGGNDEIFAPDEVQQLYAALRPYYESAGCLDQLSLKIFSHLQHQIEPPTDEISQALRADYLALQTAVANWFEEHLCA